jgi:hypothetical protein
MPETSDKHERPDEEHPYPQDIPRESATMNDIIEDHPRVELLADAKDVVDVEVEHGQTDVVYYITFKHYSGIPGGFHDHHGFDFVSAYWSAERLSWRDWLNPKQRIVGVFRERDGHE